MLGTWALAGGELTIGGLLAFLAYLAQLYRPVRDLSRLGQTVFEATAGAERVIELLDTEPRRHRARRTRGRSRAPAASSSSTRVSYRYPGSERPGARRRQPARAARPLRRAWSAPAAPASPRSRSSRCASPTPTRARCGSTATTCATSRCARCASNVALLLQDAPLFDGTVRDERRLRRARGDRRGASSAALEAAAAAGLADELPDGLDTRTGQRGRALSGGQRRRVAMARALLQDAPVLVLDEPSAGLDAEARGACSAPLRRLMRDRATLLITHDLTLAAAADEVVVLDDGRVVERGAPATLRAAAAPGPRLQRRAAASGSAA